jgi:hypothetical protein
LPRNFGVERSAGLLKQDLNEEQAMLNKRQNLAARVWSTNLGIREKPEGEIPRKATSKFQNSGIIVSVSFTCLGGWVLWLYT